MVYAKYSRSAEDERELICAAIEILARRQAVALRDLADRLSVRPTELLEFMSDELRRGMIEELRPVGEAAECAERPLNGRYLRLVRESDGDFKQMERRYPTKKETGIGRFS